MNKKIISIVMIVLMFVVFINANIKTNALEFNHIINDKKDNNSTIITEIELDSENIDIDSISLETAVDINCNNIATTNEYQVSGSITEIDNTNDTTSFDDNSSIYYVGETDFENGTLEDDSFTVSTDLDEVNYYVDNWQDLEGDLTIKVNKQASCVTVYKGETPIRAMVCSAGETTPEGTFCTDNKWDWLMLIKAQYGRYCTQISGDYLFHSVPYNSMDIYDLDTEMYNQLGTLCSHGCIRLKVEDAKWIYDNCPSGTEVTIYNDVNPGPMGKPGLQQIPADQTWDPTDIDVE